MSHRHKKSKNTHKRPIPKRHSFRLSNISACALEDRTVPTVFGAPVGQIAIPAASAANQTGPASPYPTDAAPNASLINVTGLTGQVITNLTVTLNNLSHTAPIDIDALLVAPNGTNIFLMSDVGSTTAATGVTLTFSASASGSLSATTALSSGSYLPSNADGGDTDTIPNLTAGLPARSTSLASFVGLDPNGTWKLWINDDSVFEQGTLATASTSSWSLDITSRVNATPVAVNDSYTFNEDTSLTTSASTAPRGVLFNDTDANNDTLTATLVSAPATSATQAFTFNPDGSFTFTPRPNFAGVVTFTYTASDGIATSNVGTVTLNVTNINDPPVAVADTLTIQNGGPQTIHRAVIVGNDFDPDGAVFTTLYSSDFEGYALIPWNAGTATSTDTTVWIDAPPVGWTRDNTTTPAPANSTAAGAEFFGWHLMDIDAWIAEQGDQARSSFTRGGVGAHGTVLVTDGDAYDDFISLGTTKMNTLMIAPTVSLAGIIPGSLTLELDSSYRPEDPPPANQHGRIEVSYDNGATWTSLLELTNDTSGGTGSLQRANEHLILDCNNPGTASSAMFRFSYLEAGNDWWWAIDNVKVSGNKTDPSLQTIQIQSQPSQGSVALDADGAVVYTPPSPTFTGTTSFTYRLFDGTVNSNTVAVNLTVNANNTVPVAVNDPTGYSTLQGTALTTGYTQSVLKNDTDTDLGAGNVVGMKAVLATAPTAAQGTLVLRADGTFTFTPNPAFFGTATFTYNVNDGSRVSATPATVSITVIQNNFSAPVANNDTYNVNNNAVLTVAAPGVLTNDTDADNNPLTPSVVLGPSYGTLTLNANGSFTYTPKPYFNGTDKFTYRVNDGGFNSNVATVTITVAAVNVAPQANPDAYSTTAGTALNVTAANGVLRNDRDDGPNTQLFLETFDSLPLIPFNVGPPAVPGGDGTDYTDALPTGWTRDNTTTPAPASSTTPGNEFFGLHVMDIDSWIGEQGNQNRSDFTRGGVGLHGTVIVGDGDAYDDFIDIDTNRMTSLLVTPQIPLGTITPNSLRIDFDNSFRPESAIHQYAQVDVSYDNGTTWTTILDLNQQNSGGTGSRARTNEHVVADAFNPAGATNARFRFAYRNVGNDWWWAFDNVRVSGATANAGAALTATSVTQPAHGTVTLAANGSFTYTPTAGFTGVDRFTYRTNDAVSNSAPATVFVNVGTSATGTVIDNGTGQGSMVRSLTVVFNGRATFAGSPGVAFTLTTQAATPVNVPFAVAIDNSGPNTIATITFTGTGLVGNSLADGRYRLTVLAAQVNVNGTALAADAVTNFTRYYGDSDGDGDVDGTDLVAFVPVLFNPTNYNSAFDYDGDGDVDGTDLFQYVQRLFVLLP